MTPNSVLKLRLAKPCTVDRPVVLAADQLAGLLCFGMGRGHSSLLPAAALADVLQVFARLESDRSAWRNPNFLTRSWVPSDTALSRLDLEDAEATQLDPLAPLHGGPHRIENSIDSHLGLDLGDVGDLRHLVHDVDLNHAYGLL
jgi:hypothetical protein